MNSVISQVSELVEVRCESVSATVVFEIVLTVFGEPS